MQKTLTIFDLDDTLIKGDCSRIWAQFLVHKGLVLDPNFLDEEQRLMDLYAQGELDMSVYLQFIMAPLAHLTTQYIDNLADQCIGEYILPRVYPEARELLKRLKKTKQTTMIISASMSFLVLKIARALGVEHAFGIDLEVKDGCYSCAIEGVASYREGKVIRLRGWLGRQDCLYVNLHFYTDSINDVFMCQFVQQVNVVHPDSRLSALASLHDWPKLYWKAPVLSPKQLLASL